MRTVQPQASTQSAESKRRRTVSTLFSSSSNVDKKVLENPAMFPPEIWSLICVRLSQNDLTNLALVSSKLLRISRSILYRSVCLRNDSVYLQEQAQIVREYALVIQRLTLFSTAWIPRILNSPEPVTWVDYLILSPLQNLSELILIGVPFTVEQEQINFVSFLRRMAPRCKSVTYLPHYITLFPSLSFPIEGLEKISWSTYTAKSPQPQAISALHASAQTLTSISFPNCPGFAYALPEFAQDTWSLLFSMQFPRLTSFNLGLLYADPLADRGQKAMTTVALTRFLKNHPSLQHLSLTCSLEFPGLYEGISTVDQLIQDDFLSSLQSLESHPTNIATMLSHNVKSLQNLTKLAIVYYCEANDPSLDNFFSVMRGSAGFPNVEELSLRYNGDSKFMGVFQITMLECVRRLGACCPAVRLFSGYLGGYISPQ